MPNLLFSQMSRQAYRKYNNVNIRDALDLIRSGTLSARRASAIYGVPKSTLLDRVHGRIADDAKSGPDPVLTKEEEEVLCNYVKLMCDIGYPITPKLLCMEVKRILDADGRKNPFTNNMPGVDNT